MLGPRKINRSDTTLLLNLGMISEFYNNSVGHAQCRSCLPTVPLTHVSYHIIADRVCMYDSSQPEMLGNRPNAKIVVPVTGQEPKSLSTARGTFLRYMSCIVMGSSFAGKKPTQKFSDPWAFDALFCQRFHTRPSRSMPSDSRGSSSYAKQTLTLPSTSCSAESP